LSEQKRGERERERERERESNRVNNLVRQANDDRLLKADYWKEQVDKRVIVVHTRKLMFDLIKRQNKS